MAETILILGGVGEAVRLAEILAQRGYRVIYALAGRTSSPKLPEVAVIRGGFGGAAGLSRFMRENRVDRLIDATHPFAETISRQAAHACQIDGVARIRMDRPAWRPAPGERWITAENLDKGFAKAADLGPRILVATGRRGLDRLPRHDGLSWLIRVIEPGADLPVRPDLEYLFARGPFDETEETALLQDRRIHGLVAKNSGGTGRAKITAAGKLGIPVVMIARPEPIPDQAVTSAEAVVNLLDGGAGSPP